MRSILFCLALVFSVSGAANSSVTVDGGFVIAKGKRFMAEVARTPAEKARGLMYRQYLRQDRCMFFIYEEDSYHSIWMKNCLISLDVAWIDADGKVVEIAENVPPCSPMRGDNCPSYGGGTLSRHFVEFPVGTFKRIGLKVGDQIGWELEFSDGQFSKGGLLVTGANQSAAPKTNNTNTGTANKKDM